MSYLAIMQGRLVPPEGGRFQSFPSARWRDEFAFAAQSGLNAIEWIFDLYGEKLNPITSDTGISEILTLSRKSGVAIRSLCADYFMERPFLRSAREERTELLHKLEWLLCRCRAACIGRVVLPFVDNSRIENREDQLQLVSLLQSLLPAAEENNVEIHLETSLPPAAFAALLDQLPHPLLRANYDSGNSASLGYRVCEEFAAYGHRIGSVHIKDRKLGGDSVPLGKGHADLRGVFRGLAELDYRGDYVLQIARSEAGHELRWVTQNAAWVSRQIREAKAGVL